MKRHISIIIILFLFTINFYHCSQEKKINESQVRISNGIAYELNQEIAYSGKVISYYESGKLQKVINYLNGTKHGLMITYFEDGKKDTEINYIKGKKDGLCIYWDKNGNKTVEVSFKDDEKDGKYIFWNEKGIITEEGFYKRDEMDSLWLFWNNNGKKIMQGNYKFDKKEGIWTIYDENEYKEEEGNFRNGDKDGIWIFWDENGNKNTREYENGSIVFTTEQKSIRSFPEKYGIINDCVDVISSRYEKRIESIINNISSETGISIIICTIYTIGNQSIDDYAKKLNKKYSSGEKNILILNVVGEKKIKIVGDFSSEIAGRIIDQYFIPYLKDGDYAKAFFIGLQVISEYLKKEIKK